MDNMQKDTDFIGFTFNNIHSSELGIVRTSDGSRFNENLLPFISDKTVQAPGTDGTYFFESNYTHQVFDVPFAFGSLTEEQFQKLKRWLGDKKIHDLIFDEAPYKIYRAKITGSATIKHIPFAEGETNRIYKGEGSIQFTAYDPFARSAFKFLEQATPEQRKHEQEWIAAAGMLETQGAFDQLSGNEISLYNPGVKEADFILGIKFNSDDNKIPSGSIGIDGADSILKLNFREITKQKLEDVEIRFNSKLNLIEGYDGSGIKTGSIYNRFITSGDFFKIPVSTDTSSPIKMIFENVNGLFSSIDYNYYYF